MTSSPLSSILVYIIQQLLSLVGVIVLLVRMDWLLALTIFATIPIIILITVYNIPMPLKTTVVAFDPGVFWQSEFSGPMNKGTQQWLYEPTDGETAITFTIEVEFSGPAKLAEKMVVSAFDKMADKMLANMKEMAES